MNITDISADIKSITNKLEEILKKVNLIEPENKSNEEYDINQIIRIAKQYPITEHPLSKKDEHIKKLYITVLSSIIQYDGKPIEDRLIFLSRIMQGCNININLMDVIQYGMNIDNNLYDEFIVQISKADLQYNFIVDALIISTCESKIEDKSIEYISEIASVLNISNDEMRILCNISNIVLMQSQELFDKKFDFIKSKLHYFICYTKEFVNGVLCDVEEVFLTKLSDTCFSEREEKEPYVFDLKNRGKSNFIVSPLEFALNSIKKLSLYIEEEPETLKELLNLFKKDISEIVSKKRCTNENLDKVLELIYSKLLKIYITRLDDRNLESLKTDDIEIKKSIFMRLTRYSKQAFNEKFFDEMISSKEKLYSYSQKFIKENIYIEFKEYEKERENLKIIIDTFFNGVPAAKYLRDSLKVRGKRFEYIINNVIQTLGNTDMILFNPNFMNFSDDTTVPDDYLKDEMDISYIGFLGIIQYGMYDCCINKDNKSVENFFIYNNIVKTNS